MKYKAFVVTDESFEDKEDRVREVILVPAQIADKLLPFFSEATDTADQEVTVMDTVVCKSEKQLREHAKVFKLLEKMVLEDDQS